MIEPSGAELSSDLTALMKSEGINRDQATLLRDQILASGKSVREFVLDSAQNSPYGATSTSDIFRLAGELIEVAGSVDRAIEAIKAFRF